MGSLRSLTILFLVAFSAAAVLAGFATFGVARRSSVALVDRRIHAVADALLQPIDRRDSAAVLARIDRFAATRDTGDIGFELEDAAGHRLGGNVTLTRPIPLGFSGVHPGDRIAGLSAGRAEMRDLGGGLRLITLAETEPIDGYAAIRARNYGLGFGFILMVVAGGTAAFGLLVRKRIGEVRSTAEAIIDGDMTRRVPVDPHGGAFAEQAAAFNRMLDRMNALMDNLHSVSRDVAHDLRTPLARLRGRLHQIAATTADTSPVRDDVNAALDQCDEIMALFGAILRISEIEGRARRAAFAPVDLVALVEDVREAMADEAGRTAHRLCGEGRGQPLTISGDRQLLSQATINLVENALRHTPAGTTVTLSATHVGGVAAIRVRDTGPGIAASDRRLALRRFGRLDASRNRPGHGLGLPLVDAVARLHGGALQLGDAGPGLIATMTLEPFGGGTTC